MVRVIRWVVDLGWVDILLDIALMYTYLALPRRGYLEQIFHVFGYIKAKQRRKLCFDHQHLRIDEHLFAANIWYELYWDAKEAMSADTPTPRGDVVSTNYFVDADHAGYRATRRSQTGVIIFVNNAPILWYSKRRNSV